MVGSLNCGISSLLEIANGFTPSEAVIFFCARLSLFLRVGGMSCGCGDVSAGLPARLKIRGAHSLHGRGWQL